ncbi:MAG: hypothetical protein AAB592_04620 [Patescibacteria group bacterium]
MDFFSELKKLVESKPHSMLHGRATQNSFFGDYLSQTKNVYLCFHGFDLADCYYGDFLYKCNDCVDCTALSGSELCYECVDCSDLYDCRYLQDCHNCSQCCYGIDLLNCKDCFGCFGLRNAQYYIFNKKYTEESYRAKIADLRKTPAEKVLAEIQPYFLQHPRLFARQLKGEENCYGDYIYYSKNCYMCFGIKNAQSCGYVYDAVHTQTAMVDSYDTCCSGGLEGCYSCVNTLSSNNSNFLIDCAGMSDSEYCIECYSCRSCFGCSYLQNKEYHILNKPFSRTDYIATLRQIKGLLKEQGTEGMTWDRILHS